MQYYCTTGQISQAALSFFCETPFLVRPLYHPALREITVQGILYALSDPVRMQIFVKLARGECDKNCTAFAHIGNVSLPKSTLSQHFKALREAGLIRSERKGVELLNHTRCAELKGTFGPLIDAIIAAYGKETRRRGKPVPAS